MGKYRSSVRLETAQMIQQLYEDFGEGHRRQWTHEALAMKFGLSTSTVRRITNRLSPYDQLPMPLTEEQIAAHGQRLLEWQEKTRAEGPIVQVNKDPYAGLDAAQLEELARYGFGPKKS